MPTFNPFESARLVYRAVEDSPEDDALFHAIKADAEGQSGAQPWLLKPESKTTALATKKDTAEAYMGAVICLKPSEEGAANPGPSADGTPPRLTPIGVVVLSVPGDTVRNCSHHRNGWGSMDIIRKYRSKGYGTEAAEWLLGYTFQIAGMHKINVNAFGYNDGAISLYRRMGFVEDGCLRDELWFNGAWHPSYFFSMLEDEWRARNEKAARKWGEY